MITQLKRSIAVQLLPLIRLYIRYSPFSLFKPFLWQWWRNRPYLARQYVVRTRFGTVMAGHSLDLVQGYIYYFGIWEPNLTEFVIRRLGGQSDRTFIDVGAHVGYFSLLAASQMRSGNVVSIEPFPSIYAKLQKNIELNGFRNIRTLPQAATQTECEIQLFHAGPRNEGATTIVPGKFNTEPISVKGTPLSELVTESEVHSMRLMKVDVEGAEYSVVQGMRSIMDKFQPDAEIIVEINPNVFSHETLTEMFKMFETVGFFPYALENSYAAMSYLVPQPIARPTRLRSLPTVQTDVIFSKVDAESL